MSTSLEFATDAAEAWAREEFGSADLGHGHRNKRLLQVATGAARNPHGQISSVFKSDAERQGAYGFVENPAVAHEELAAAAGRACARRSKAHPFVFVPVDSTSLNLKDPYGMRDMGRIGPGNGCGRGLNVVTALAFSPDGTPLGMAGQRIWKRPLGKLVSPKKRVTAEKETFHWLDVTAVVARLFAAEAPNTKVWVQQDRWGDFRENLEWVADRPEDLHTIRAAKNRKVDDERGEYLWDVMKEAEVLGQYELLVPANRKRAERTAQIEVRAARVTIVLRRKKGLPERRIELTAVKAEEVSPVPRGVDHLQWVLLTNYTVETFEDACWVIYGYSMRWQIEPYHRAWKTDCHVEACDLHAENAMRWVTILASVAVMRIERIKHLARNEPKTPAVQEFSRDEIDVTIAMRKPKGYYMGDEPTVGEMVRWIADLGGYAGAPESRGPPGSTVIRRGMDRLAIAVEAVQAVRESRPQAPPRRKLTD